MGASSSGLLDEAKITNIKGKTREHVFFFFFTHHSLVLSAAVDTLIRTVHKDFDGPVILCVSPI